MTVTMVVKASIAGKNKQEQDSALKTQAHNLEVLIEQIAQFNIEVEKSKLVEKKLKEAKEKLLAMLPTDLDATTPYVFEGTLHRIEVSSCSKVRSIVDLEKVKIALGDVLFMKIAKVGLTEIDMYLSDQEKSDLTLERYTGARKMSIKEN